MATQTINYDINVNAGQSTRTIQQMEQELNELNNEIKEVGVGSAAFEKAAGNIQKLEKELKTTQATVEGFTLDKKLEAADGAIKVVAGSVAGLTGAVGLLGIESEEFDKLTAQATNAIAFGMGIKDVSEGVGKLAKNFTVAGTQAKIFAAGQKALNLVQRAFNAILNANPIGLTILAITTLIGLVVGLKDKFEAVNKVFQFFKGLVTSVGEALGLTATAEEKAAQAAKEASEQRVKDIDNELKVRKAAGEDTVELEREKQRLLTSLTEEGSQERKDIEADSLAYEAGLLKAKQDAIDKAEAEAAKKRADARAKKKAEDEAAQKVIDDAAAQKVLDDAQKETDRLKAIAAAVLEFTQAAEDLEDETRLAKLEREEERKIAELEKLGKDNEAIKLVEDYYRELKAEAETLDREERTLKETEAADAKLAAMYENIDKEFQIENERIQMKQFALDSIIGFANAESAIGKAALIAKQILNAKALVIEAKAALSSITTKAAAASADVATGFGKTLAAGFPQNVPLLIAYAAQAASIVAAIVKAVGAAKSQIGAASGGAAGGSGGGGEISGVGGIETNPPVNQANIDLGTSPETQVQNNTIQTYVISGDITSSQEAEAKLNARRTISG